MATISLIVSEDGVQGLMLRGLGEIWVRDRVRVRVRVRLVVR